MQRTRGPGIRLDQDAWDRWTREGTLPSPFEQAENLLLHVASHSHSVGEFHDLNAYNLRATIGAVSPDNLIAVLDYLLEQELLKGSMNGSGATAGLSFEGWRRVEELRRQSPRQVRRAFMAMQFGDPDLDHVFRVCFKQAAKAAGYSLTRLDEAAPAGLIDNRLKIEIHRARFLVADLTNANAGAYWEAGYADGLGKPVIYSCRKDFFEAREPHFDTNHHHTVIWDPSALDDAMIRLRDCIRATLPTEATLDD